MVKGYIVYLYWRSSSWVTGLAPIKMPFHLPSNKESKETFLAYGESRVHCPCMSLENVGAPFGNTYTHTPKLWVHKHTFITYFRILKRVSHVFQRRLTVES